MPFVWYKIFCKINPLLSQTSRVDNHLGNTPAFYALNYLPGCQSTCKSLYKLTQLF